MKELGKGLAVAAVWTVVGIAIWKSPEITTNMLWLGVIALFATGAITS